MSSRKDTPELIKRILRRESGFGCCACGHPILEYHHIIPWERKPHFRPEDMMCLCPEHHRFVTSVHFPEDRQRRWKTRPHNIRAGRTAGQLYIGHEPPLVDLGGNMFQGEGPILTIDDRILLAVYQHDESLLISCDILNEQGELVAKIIRNEWVTGESTPWDLEFNYNRLHIRSKLYATALKIDARTNPIQITGRLQLNSMLLGINKQGLSFGANGIVNFRSTNSVYIDYGLGGNTKSPKMWIVKRPSLRSAIQAVVDEHSERANTADR